MNTLLRKLRDVIGIGLTWGMVWTAIGAVLSIVVGVVDPDSIDAGEGPIRVGAILGGVGLISGVLFGILLSLAESGRAILNISLIRVAMWGILDSAAVPLLTERQDQVLVLCPVGPALAMASVAIARKGARFDSKQPKRLRKVPLVYVLTSVQDAVHSPKEPSM